MYLYASVLKLLVQPRVTFQFHCSVFRLIRFLCVLVGFQDARDCPGGPRGRARLRAGTALFQFRTFFSVDWIIINLSPFCFS